MEKKELIDLLQIEEAYGDPEAAHSNADELLLSYINDPDIRDAYSKIKKWYA